MVGERREEVGFWDHASGRSGGGGDYGADHHSHGIMLLIWRQQVFAPQCDRNLDISLGQEGEHFLLLPNSPDWAKKEGEWGQ